eukprot:788443-Rhodomonas_salina.1
MPPIDDNWSSSSYADTSCAGMHISREKRPTMRSRAALENASDCKYSVAGWASSLARRSGLSRFVAAPSMRHMIWATSSCPSREIGIAPCGLEAGVESGVERNS